MIRSKGEAGTGDVSNATTHMRQIRGEIRRLSLAARGRAVRRGQGAPGARTSWSREVAETGQAARRAVHRRRHRHPGRRRDDDAARRRGRVRRLRHLQVRQPGPARRGDRQGHHVLRRPRRDRQGLAAASARPWSASTSTTSPRRTASPSAAGSGASRPCARSEGRFRRFIDGARAMTAPHVGVLAPAGRRRASTLARARAAGARRASPYVAPAELERPSTAWCCPAGSPRRWRSWRRTFGLLEPLRERIACRAARLRLLRRDDPARRPDPRRARRPADHRRARHDRAPQRVRPAGRLLRGATSTSPGSTATRCTRSSSGRPGSRRSGPASRSSPASRADLADGRIVAVRQGTCSPRRSTRSSPVTNGCTATSSRW